MIKRPRRRHRGGGTGGTITAEKALRDPSTSEWLRTALRTALDRDAVTVAREAALLAHILRRRLVRLAQRQQLHLPARVPPVTAALQRAKPDADT